MTNHLTERKKEQKEQSNPRIIILVINIIILVFISEKRTHLSLKMS